MINDKNLKQEGGERSTNLQGGVVNVYQGLSYADVREIALDIFKSNFLHLKNEAAEIAAQRAEEITETILSKLNEKAPETLNEFKQPAMQDALFNAQKEFAKSGDKDLGDLLVDIILDRANTPERNMLQIVLDESLKIAPRLTVEQFDTITLSFLLTRTKILNIKNVQDFRDRVNEMICPFIENLTSERSHYNYIEYLGCGYIRAGEWGEIENNFRERYKAIFSKGFTKDEFEQQVGSIDQFSQLIIPCLNDPSKFQLNTMDIETFDGNAAELMISSEDQQKLKNLWNNTTMNNQEVKDFLVGINPLISKLFEVWQTTSIKNLELTSVGIAIAHANYRRRTGKTLDLSIWIK